MKKQERVVPVKNYYLLALLILMVVIVTFSIFEINDRYQINKLNTSYLSGYLNEIKENEIDNIMAEATSDFFVLITETKKEDVYDFEVQLKKIINRYDLRENFIYIDYSDKSEDLESLNKKFGSDIKSIPAILYFKDGKFVKSIDNSETTIKIDDFDKLLDEYEIKEN